jgi:hypothetical protein
MRFFADRKAVGGRWRLTLVLSLALLSGCASVIGNSENFYQDMPRRPTNWREYLSD